MNRQYLKTFVATFLAGFLLYYGAAWAVLRCCHYEAEATSEVSRFDAELANPHLRVWRPSDAATQIDCLDFEYHAETLGGPASPPQFHRVTAAVTPCANHFSVLKNLAESHKNNFSGNAFPSGSPPSEPSYPPLYLSLSSLRF